MWWDIIKETRLSSKQTSRLNWEEEMVPDEEQTEEPCKERIKQLKKYIETFTFTSEMKEVARNIDKNFSMRRWIGETKNRFTSDSDDYLRLSIGIKNIDDISEEQCCFWLSKLKIVLESLSTPEGISQKELSESTTDIGSRENIGDMSCYHSTHGRSSDGIASNYNMGHVYLDDIKTAMVRGITFRIAVKAKNHVEPILKVIRDILGRL